MSDLSPGERALLRLRWFVYDAGSRPVVIASVLLLVATLAAMAAALLAASTSWDGGLGYWVFLAESGFTDEVELGVLVAALLLVIDSRTGDPFPAQRTFFVALAVLAGIGVVANMAMMVYWLTQAGDSAIPLGTGAEAWTEIVTSFSATAAIAATAGWIALTGARSVRNPGGLV